MGRMPVRDDCRHYTSRTSPSGEKRETCRLGVNDDLPFACPEGCLFFEQRGMGTAWTVPEG
jgi:hypothetical protein